MRITRRAHRRLALDCEEEAARTVWLKAWNGALPPVAKASLPAAMGSAVLLAPRRRRALQH